MYVADVELFIKVLSDLKISTSNINNCSTCGKPHFLNDEDAGSDREIKRQCVKCYNN